MADRSVREDQSLAIVVGAGGGLGMACARRMGQRYRVVLADIDARRVETLASQLCEEGIAALASPCDVTDRHSVATLFDTLPRTAPLAALVHVVGLSPSVGDWKRIMAVNLQGAARVADAALPHLTKGVGVFISSMAGHLTGDLTALHRLLDAPLAEDFMEALEVQCGRDIDASRSYMISKYGLNRMCRRLARTWGERGNRIVSLSPGLIATPMGQREFHHSPQKHELLARIPLGRQGGMQEIADALEFLCSERASFISGTDLLVDGGLGGTLRG
ncbi:SDR family oxidoreductase [Paraburkholderia dinghuensis]|uniref:SDR family oxidoreductase n=1 Tax=Paraburkholderia dinghuensis TaxID=2305225 RepID=A0A3N6PSF8_9BURK|nr:SDR family oxidoreductase [Paraburkholderia dinghuensis]RQH04900.1 SDR family oxidoreductase [Paraburkholderia dinghuensis]